MGSYPTLIGFLFAKLIMLLVSRVMDFIIADCSLDAKYAYIDDVIIYTEGNEEHYRKLQSYKEAVSKYNVCLNLNKCQDSQNIIKYQG